MNDALNRQARRLIGKRIMQVDLGRFYNREFGGWFYDPTFILEDGTRIRFSGTTLEDSVAIRPIIIPPRKETDNG